MNMTEDEWAINGCPDGVVVLCTPCDHPLDYHEEFEGCTAALSPGGVSGQSIMQCPCERWS